MYPLWNFFLTRRAFTILSMVTLLVAGAYSLLAMPKESAPEVIVPIGIVSTVLPGATAADIERLVTDKIEPAVRNVANIDKVTSSSRQGVSVITAEFIASADVDTSIQDLRNAVENTRKDLPSDAEAPIVTKLDFQDQPILMVGIGSDLAPETLTKLGEDLKDDLISVEGVSKVEVGGTRTRQISVIINRDALANHNLRVESVMQALARANASVPAGSLTIDSIDYPIQFEGDINDVETIRNIPLTTPSGDIRLSDVATVIDGFEKTNSISRLKQDGDEAQFALSLNIYKAAGGNILTTSKNVKERLKELERTTLAGSEAVITYDAAEEVHKSISELTVSGIQTVTLVMLVLFVAIGFYEAIVAALAIPFSFMIAFIGMLVTGNTINFVSLFALIIAIGILVDSGIVVVEGIHTNRENGMHKFEAARKALKDFGWPLIAGVATTVAVFVPLFFLSGILGQFVKSIPFTVVVVLLASIVVALGFIPTIALGLIRHEESKFAMYREHLWESLSSWYRAKIELLFSSKKLQRYFFAFLAIAFIGGLALPVTGLLKVVMFPSSDVDLFYIEVELPQATTLSETDKIAKQVEALVADTPYLESVMTTVGSQSAFNSNGGGSGSKFANITVNLLEERHGVNSIDITEALRNKLANVDFGRAKVTVFDPESGPPSSAPVTIKIWSDETDALASATEAIQLIVEKTTGTTGVTSSLANDGTELAIEIDRNKAEEYGLTTADVASTLRAAIAGTEATKVRLSGDDVEVRVMFNLNPDFVNPEDTTVTTADSIASVPVATSRGVIPLGSLINIRAKRSSSVISHENGIRVGSVSAYNEEGVNSVELTKEIQDKIATLNLPDSVRVTYGGETEDIKKTFTEMLIALASGLVLMFSILVLEFDKFRTSLRLLSAIPLSLAGVLWGLFLMGQPLSFTAFLGIIALAGVIINHGILLLDAMNARREENPDATPEELVVDTAVSRVRPIILTTLTTVVGMIPLVFVSAMWAPLAFTIAFGLMYGTLLTLVYIPLLSYRREKKLLKNKQQKA